MQRNSIGPRMNAPPPHSHPAAAPPCAPGPALPAPLAWFTAWLLAAAVAAPTLLAYNHAPSATFFNQALSFGLWGWLVMALGFALPLSLPAVWRAARPLLAVLLLLALAVAWSHGPGALPATLAWSAWLTLAAAAVVTVAGACAALHEGQPGRAWRWFCAGVLAAACASAAIAFVQVFAPAWIESAWLARSGIPGRAVGNLRQPNHLSSLLVWGLVASVALLELRRLPGAMAALLGAALVWAVVLTASRTGLGSVLVLALWGALDRRLAPRTRWLLLALPLLYGLAWQGMAMWAETGGHRFGGAERLAESDLSSSRWAIFRDTLRLIAAHPWAGVGFGEFNFAWSLSVLPDRPVAFFDHAHNLPLHLAAELGLPLASVVVGMLLWALWRVARSAWAAVTPAPPSGHSLVLRSAFVFVLMIGLHSLVEYPLWYAYFLLPTAFAWALALGTVVRALARNPEHAGNPAPLRTGSVALMAAGAALVAGAAVSVLDYQRVALIFNAPDGAAPLAARIEAGQRSWLFAHHADYAAATTDTRPVPLLAPFERSTHYLLDTRLMTAWAEALAAHGQRDQAQHLAARLREFRNPASAEFFAPCGAGAVERSGLPPPFQCQAGTRALGWREFAR
jgi:O-antigen ligase